MAEIDLPPAAPFAIGPSDTGGAVVGGAGLLRGYAVENTDAANPARLILLDGQNANGQPLVPIRLAPNESTRELWAGKGVLFQGGLFGSVTAGAIFGVCFVTLEDALPPGLWRQVLNATEYVGG